MNEKSYNAVFETIIEGEADLVGLVAYGHYKRNKRDWIVGFTDKYRRVPTADDIEAYVIGQSTPQMIQLYRSQARDELGAYAAYIVDAETPAIREAALSGEFLQKIDRATHWIPLIGFNIAGAFTYTLILILLAVVLTWIGVDLLSILGRLAQ